MVKRLFSHKLRENFNHFLNMAILGDQGCEDADVQTFLIKEDEVNEHEHEATYQHIALAKALWSYKLKN